MAEPIYVAQTFEPEHLADKTTRTRWFFARFREALDLGADVPRTTHAHGGLLIEVWVKKPRRYGEPRWSFQAGGE